MTEQQQQLVYRRKGTRVIYPFTETNAKNANLIPMTIAEAQEEGLLAPREESREDPVLTQLKEQNEILRAKIAELESVSAGKNSKPAVKKKRVSKKPVAEIIEPPVEEQDEDAKLKDSLSSLGIQMDG